MELEEIKSKMLAYRDFYGGELSVDRNRLLSAKTKEELSSLIEEHRDFLSDCASDAESHLYKFKKSIELSTYNINENTND